MNNVWYWRESSKGVQRQHIGATDPSGTYLDNHRRSKGAHAGSRKAKAVPGTADILGRVILEDNPCRWVT